MIGEEQRSAFGKRLAAIGYRQTAIGCRLSG
jgi:hypothetical protein